MSFKDVVVLPKLGRPKDDLPVETIKELYKQGYSYRKIAEELEKRGIITSKSSIGRILGPGLKEWDR